MPKKALIPSKKKAKKNSQSEGKLTADAESTTAVLPVKEVGVTAPAGGPANKDKIQKKADKTQQSPATKEPVLVPTEEELKFIAQLRNNDKNAEKRMQEQAKKDTANRQPSPEEMTYAAIFAPTTTLNSVHAHCLGIVLLEPLELRDAVAEALKDAKAWDANQKALVRSALAKAMPSLGEKLVGERGLPVPESFSAERMVEAYIHILERHLAFTKILTTRRKSKRRSDSSEDDAENGERRDSRKDKSEEMALKAVTKDIEESLRIGKEEYPSEHLYECERLLVEYRQWNNPEDGSVKPATISRTVRDFIKRHLAESSAPVSTAFEQPHVKASAEERKHVTFLLNRMGFLSSKIVKERLARSGKELNRHGRLRKGAELSAKERKESIAGEKQWAGEVRWLSVLLSKGIKAYRKFDNGQKTQASQAHLHSAGILPAASCKAVAASVASCDPGESRRKSRSRSRSKSRRRRNSDRHSSKGGRYRRRYRHRGDYNRDGDRRRDEKPRPDISKLRCWHCNERGHQVMDCPSAKAGKPPAKGSRFAKSRAKGDKEKDE